MKNFLFFLLASYFFIQLSVQAQDTIYLANESTILAKATKFANDTVFFIKYPTATLKDSSLYHVLGKEVTKIKYANGLVYEVTKASPIRETPIVSSKTYQQGFADSQVNYTDYKDAALGTLVTTAVGGMFLGLVPTVACASSPPKVENLGIAPDSPVLKDQAYMAGYNKGAAQLKRKRVIGSYGVGLAVRTVAIAAILISSLTVSIL